MGKIFKKIESKSGSKNIFWSLLISAKDFLWIYTDRLIKKYNNVDISVKDFLWIYTPPAIEIEINTTCNRRCKYCPNSICEKSLEKNEILIEKKLFKKIIDELAEIDFCGRVSPHFYGEPLLNKSLVEFVQYTKNMLPKSNMVLYTNGDYLDIFDYSKLSKAGLDKIVVSQHGDCVPKNIAKLFSYLDQQPSEKTKIEYIKFNSSFSFYNRGGSIDVKNPSFIPRCKDLDNALVIDVNGNVILCCNDYYSSVKLGNLYNEKLIDIWNKNEYRKIRRQLRNDVYSLAICKKCTGLIK